jgi:oxygen-dependent protoporphyrinogen oxidase
LSQTRGRIFIGGGIGNLLIALWLYESGRMSRDELPITIFESEEDVGGLFRSYSYPDGSVFDSGMHVFYETLDRELDSTWWSLLPNEEWNVLEGNRKDIAGVFFDGRLQQNSPYPDLRSGSFWRRLNYLSSVLMAAQTHGSVGRRPDEEDTSARRYFERRFGVVVARDVYEPILLKIFGVPGSQLSPLATQLLAMNRVVLLPLWAMKRAIKNPKLACRIAFPEQLDLPIRRVNSERGLYPNRVGMGRVVDSLKARLLAHGARIFTSTRIVGMKFEDSQLIALESSSIEKGPEIHECATSQVYWGAGPHVLMQLALRDRFAPVVSSGSSAMSHRSQWIVDGWLAGPNLIDPLFYFYCFDNNSSIFRVTNYAGYSSCSRRDQSQISIELWVDGTLKSEQVADLALSELLRMRVISRAEQIEFCGARKIGNGFPLLTTEIVLGMKELAAHYKAVGNRNFHLVGAARDPSIFFLRDVLIQTKRVVENS